MNIPDFKCHGYCDRPCLAIALAQEGGIGIHKSMTIEQQAKEVWAVKKYESGVVKNPFTLQGTATLADLHAFTEANNISGVPILDKNNSLVLSPAAMFALPRI